MLEKIKLMHHNDQCKINFSKTYGFLLNFEMKNSRLNHSTDQNMTKKFAEK